MQTINAILNQAWFLQMSSTLSRMSLRCSTNSGLAEFFRSEDGNFAC